VAGFAVFDIDGVLADVRHRLHHVQRRPKRWGAFFDLAAQDAVLADGFAMVRHATEEGLSVVYSTGRPERCRADTLEWLTRHEFPAAPLHMRRERDRRPGRVTKLAVARSLRANGGVAYLVDDDPAVVTDLRAAGFEVVHATWMTDSPGTSAAGTAQQLFDLQEGGEL
jgi:phosphoglycolate phosphatase-like HAD superfamily hydrolase